MADVVHGIAAERFDDRMRRRRRRARSNLRHWWYRRRRISANLFRTHNIEKAAGREHAVIPQVLVTANSRMKGFSLARGEVLWRAGVDEKRTRTHAMDYMADHFAKRYPQGETDEAYPISFSMSNATSSFP